jgi:hypothetical protein
MNTLFETDLPQWQQELKILTEAKTLFSADVTALMDTTSATEVSQIHKIFHFLQNVGFKLN